MSSEAGAAPKEGRLRNPICRLTLSLGARNWLVASSSRRFSLSTIFRDFTPANTKFLATLYYTYYHNTVNWNVPDILPDSQTF